MEIYTIGFTQKSARQFFDLLKANGIRRLIDIRLSNTGQLAGFTKSTDLAYFLEEICGAEYTHQPLLAPTKQLLTDYRNGRTSWAGYERIFESLMTERQIETAISPSLFNVPSVMLCSEPTADQCHRRLVAEYLQRHWDDVTIHHL
ncbi:MAG TPA: DUF488 domain-containing protein [Thermomicrobiales bacterium]|nr:DUF488 domain-containing protein [Thermomicrobiales bacterium]